MMPDFFNSKDDELVLPSYPQDPDQIANRRKLVDKTEKLLQKNEVEYNIDSDNKRDFINAAPSIIGERNLPIELTLFDNISNLCSYLNKELVSIGGHMKRDNYNNLYLYYDKSLMKESVITEDIKSTVSNIRTKIKNKIDTISSSLRPMTRLEASKKYDVISDEDVKEIKSIIKKVSDEAIKIFSSGSSPFTGSSSTMISGFGRSAIPIPRRCFMPRENLLARFFPVFASPTRSSISSMRFSSGYPRR